MTPQRPEGGTDGRDLDDEPLDDQVAGGHALGDPQESLEHFTTERQAAARPRGIRLDDHGRRLPEESRRDDVGADSHDRTP